MPLFSSLATLSQTAGSNAADGSVDAPSTVDNNMNLLASFIAQLRDGNGFLTGVGNIGQCRLSKSGADLILRPYLGNGLSINGVVYAIPSAGVTLAASGLTPSTLYYIYAYMNAGVMTLEASTTTHATSTSTGVEIKSGDATRTLVGMARPITGPAWQDATNQRFVTSWFNRKPVEARSVLAANQAVANATYGEISTSLRTEFLVWSGDSVQFAFQGSISCSLSGAVCDTQLAIDSASGTSESYSSAQAPAASSFLNPYCGVVVTASEGYHFVTPLAKQSGGATATYIGGGASGARCVVSGTVLL